MRGRDVTLAAPLLAAEGLGKSFAGIVALENVSLQVDYGERVGLIGPNGAGKTTLFNCIHGMLVPDSGTVSLAGHDISKLPVHLRARRGIGRTFQRIELFPDSTVRDHLVIADRVRHAIFLEHLQAGIENIELGNAAEVHAHAGLFQQHRDSGRIQD